VTDLALTGVVPAGNGPDAAPTVPAVEVVAGIEVQALVEHSEQAIQALRRELEEALREAEEAERQAASHPGVAHLAESINQGWTDPTGQTAIVAPVGDAVGAGPRTTVVSRPRATPAAADGSGTSGAPGHRHSASDPVSGWAGAFTSHLVLKIGVLLTLVAVLLLVFL